jgi:spermidine synthase
MSDEVQRREALTLLSTVFIVAACGLIYELLLATVSSYLVGSSVTQFSLCIGTFIGAMGLGSYLSQHVATQLLRVFLLVEIALAVVGGVSAWALFAAYATLGGGYWAVLIGFLALIGALTGIELPLLTRLLTEYGALRTTIAQALSFDYVGALLGSVAFPVVLLPTLGTTRTAFAIGLLNLAIAFWNLWVFSSRLRAARPAQALCVLLALPMLAGLLFADRATGFFERRLYDDQILLSRQTPYQRIVVTRLKNDLRLYLDGNLQFSTADEYRYHETLVHPALALTASRERVLILGGGDGLAVREVLKWPDVRSVTVVDIDPAMTKLAQTYPALVAANAHSLTDPRVHIEHKDAFTFLADDPTERYGAILCDLPDPNGEALAKLFSRDFFRRAKNRLGRGGVLVTQATSPLFSRDAFWCVVKTVGAAGFTTTPYHVYVPSFGDWGFVLARPDGPAPQLFQVRLPTGLTTRYWSAASPAALTAFDADNGPVTVEISTLEQPRILGYYEREAKQWEH